MPTRKTNRSAANHARASKAREWRGILAHRSQLHPDVMRKVCTALETGAPQDLAAELAGVHPDTLRRWQRRAEALLDRDDPPPEELIYVAADAMMRRARAKFLMGRIRELVTDPSPSRWRRALEILSRRDPDAWAARPQRTADPFGTRDRRPPDEAYL